ncbi:MAG: cell division protein FtsZ, partial [Reinekea sp.]
EIRVTVVATGIGEAPAKVAAKPKVAIDNTRRSDGSIDYKQLDRPTAARVAASSRQTDEPSVAQPVKTLKDLDYLDIPAFLRRQAD